MHPRLWRIDPDANVATASSEVGPDATGVAFGDGSVWVMHSHSGTVSRVNPRTLQVTATIRVGNYPGGIAFGSGRVFVAVDGVDQLRSFEGGTGNG